MQDIVRILNLFSRTIVIVRVQLELHFKTLYIVRILLGNDNPDTSRSEFVPRNISFVAFTRAVGGTIPRLMTSNFSDSR